MIEHITLRTANPRSGYYRVNDKGKTAYTSFVPCPLQEVRINTDQALKELADSSLEHLIQKDKEAKDFSREEVDSSVSMAFGLPALCLATNEDHTDKRMEEDSGNLLRALYYGISQIDSLPLSGRLLKDLHWMIMQGGHNEKSYPGEFRTSPIWIGKEDDSLSTASFVPPSPEDMLPAFYDLERYINEDVKNIHPLIKAALVHYQFEVIHPFIDGNGRVGRLLTLLFLMNQDILHGCMANISHIFHMWQFPYYTGMVSVEVSGTYERWITFFLKALSLA